MADVDRESYQVKNFQASLPQRLEAISKFISVTIIQAYDLLGSTWDGIKESPLVTKTMEFTNKGVSAILPVLENIVEYSVEKIKQHPWLFGLIFLITFWKCCCSSSDSRRTMKAPGRKDKILRRDFEKDPRSYFRGLRGKSD